MDFNMKGGIPMVLIVSLLMESRLIHITLDDHGLRH